MTAFTHRVVSLSLALAFAGGCMNDAPPSKRTTAAGATSTSRPKVDDSAAGSIDLGAGAPYRVAPPATFGAVVGTLKFADSASASGSAGASNAPECASKTRGGAAASTAKTFGNTVVWIANVKTGKSMPADKRADVSSENCVLDPRVQAVAVGTTVNVINDDKVLHKLVFTKLGTRDTLIATPFFNAGEVVATERIAKTPGIVEVRCAQHPWERGYIAVFDHPYFTVTEDNGSFKIDSLAPGAYTVMIWHEGAVKPTSQQIQVTAGGIATISRD